MCARFALGLRRYLREPMTLERAGAVVRERLEHRGEAFLSVVEKGVYGFPRSPYLPLLEQAGCELGDVRSMVEADGVEATLERLAAAGVYVSFEEFKGRAPIERGRCVLRVDDDDFSNPLTPSSYVVETGGSTGYRKRVATDLQHLAGQAPEVLLGRHAHGTVGAPMAVWREPLPAAAGIATILRAAKHGPVPVRWFSPITSRDVRIPFKYRLATRAFVRLGRALGTPIPRPEPLPLAEADRIARWARATADEAGRCVVATTVSLSVRICIAAVEAGLRLDGVVFAAGSEPATPAKVEVVRATGAAWMPSYYSVEAGAIGLGCARPRAGDDLHLLDDCLALVLRRRPVSPRRAPGDSREVDAFCFTSLLPSSAKILLNVESDDYGVVETRSCGCPLGDIGLERHLLGVRSYGKLTGEGVTLVASEVERLLDEVLPRRFGGSPLDYQLLEEEGADSLGRLSLLIAPEVAIGDEGAVLEALLDELSRRGPAAEVAQAVWRQAGTLRIRRERPRWSPRGKLPPLHSVPRSAR